MVKSKHIVWADLFRDEFGEETQPGKEEREEDGSSKSTQKVSFRQPRSPVEDVFYINPNDHANIQLVASPLVGDNYHIWSKSVHRALGARNKLDFIFGFRPNSIGNPYRKQQMFIGTVTTSSTEGIWANGACHLNDLRVIFPTQLESGQSKFGRGSYGQNRETAQTDVPESRDGISVDRLESSRSTSPQSVDSEAKIEDSVQISARISSGWLSRSTVRQSIVSEVRKGCFWPVLAVFANSTQYSN